MDESARNKMPHEAVLGSAKPATPIGAEGEIRVKLMEAQKRALSLERAMSGIEDPIGFMAKVRMVLLEAITKVENDRTLWTPEWHEWLLDARHVLDAQGEKA